MPVNYTEAVAAAMPWNLALLRAARSLSFDQLAARSGVSKGMLVQIEQGRTNPSLATLCKIASALGVTVARLVELSPTGVGRVLGAEDFTELWRSPRGGSARLLAGSDGPRLVEFWHWRLAQGDRSAAEAHPRGTIEMLFVLAGRVTVEVGGATLAASEGELIMFEAANDHAYLNGGDGEARFVMVVIEPRAS